MEVFCKDNETPKLDDFVSIEELRVSLEKNKIRRGNFMEDKVKLVGGQSKGGSLARALRIIAAVVIVAAGGVFLFQGWSGFDSLQRVLSFIGFAAILGISGVMCAFKLREEKGARTALILAASLIPVIASQIGALIYSLSHAAPNGPAIFILRAASYTDVAFACLAASLVLVPLAYTAFSVMARAKARELSLVFLASSLVLLIPFRSPDTVGLIALVLLASIFAVDIKFLKQETSLKTFEGGISRLLPFLSFVILIGRNLMMYEPSAMLFSAIFAGVGGALFLAIPHYVKDEAPMQASQALGAVFLCGSWANLVYAVFEFLLGNSYLISSSKYFLPVVGIPMAIFILALSYLAESEGKGYRVMAGSVAVFTCLLQMAAIGGIFSSVLCIVVAIAVIALGYVLEEHVITLAGVFGLVLGMASHARYAVIIYGMSPWLTLAIIGVGVLVVSSVLERNYEAIAAKFPTKVAKIIRDSRRMVGR